MIRWEVNKKLENWEDYYKEKTDLLELKRFMSIDYKRSNSHILVFKLENFEEYLERLEKNI